MSKLINFDVQLQSTFHATNATVNKQLEAFHQRVSDMARLRRRKAGVSVGGADVRVVQQFQKGEWKWAHQPKANDARMTPDPRSGGPRREQWSQFWCMVNTNKVPTGGSDPLVKSDTRDDMVKAMAHALQEIQNKPMWWGPRGNDLSCFKWGAGANLSQDQANAYKKDRQQPSVYIKNIDIEAPKAEQGEKQHRLHVHFTMRIQHYSNIQLNSKGFQQVFKKLYNDYLIQRKGYNLDDKMLFLNGAKPLLWAKLMPQPNSNHWLDAYAKKQSYPSEPSPAPSQFNANAESRVQAENI